MWDEKKVQPAADTSYLFSSEPWNRLGFMQHAQEYWMLAHIILEESRRSRIDENPCPLLRNTGLCHYDMTTLNILIKECQFSKAGVV